MRAEYKPLPPWSPPAREQPSPEFHGETTTAVIHEAVGRALSMWEHVESVLIKLFQLLCETESLAAPRAYGTPTSAHARQSALIYAAEEFFARRDTQDQELVLGYSKAYVAASAYRNQIAHGMAMQPHEFGCFLCPPSYAGRRRETPYPTQQWAFGAKYFYRVQEIDRIRDRFE